MGRGQQSPLFLLPALVCGWRRLSPAVTARQPEAMSLFPSANLSASPNPLNRTYTLKKKQNKTKMCTASKTKQKTPLTETTVPLPQALKIEGWLQVLFFFSVFITFLFLRQIQTIHSLPPHTHKQPFL